MLKRFAIVAASVFVLVAPAHAQVKILSVRCLNKNLASVYSTTISGEIKNLSDQTVGGFKFVATFRSRDGTMLGSDTGAPSYNPILPGQSSPFRVTLIPSNPAVASADLGLTRRANSYDPLPVLTGATTVKCSE